MKHRSQNQGKIDSNGIEGCMHVKNMHHTPVNGNFKDEHGNTKPTTVETYNTHMEYAYSKDRMAMCYLMNCCTFKWMKKLLLDLLDLTVLNSWILSPTCETKICHRNCHLCLVRNLTDKAGKLRHLHPLTKARPSYAAKNVDHSAMINSHHCLVWLVRVTG
jgi:hypothetical protein